jgi:hypothetical protein
MPSHTNGRHENTCGRPANRGSVTPDGARPAFSFPPANDKSGSAPFAAAWATNQKHWLS